MTFSPLSPAVIQAIRDLDTRVMAGLSENIRETVRAYVEQGLREGRGPRDIARGLRETVGLFPHQLDWIDGLRARLEAEGKPADRAVAAFTKRLVAANAETVTRTAALDAQKLGQHLATQQAIESGDLDPVGLTKRWSGTLDDRERDTHLAMEGETVPWDQPYSNGQDFPGQGEFNCRCVSIFSHAPPKAGAGAFGVNPVQLNVGEMLRV